MNRTPINEFLNEKEKSVIKYRYGIGGTEPMTLEQIGQIFNVTRERIRQIEAKALKKMREHPDVQHMRDYLED